MDRKSLVAGAVAMGILGSAAAHSQQAPSPDPIRVGILDLKADRTTMRSLNENVSFNYREFQADGLQAASVKTPNGEEHGQVVATALVNELRRLAPHAPIEVYAGNAFAFDPKDPKTMRLDFDQAVKAIHWMHDSGVKVVVTSFNSYNEAGCEKLVSEASSLGMTVFAGGSNRSNAGIVYPAAIPEVISVGDLAESLALKTDEHAVSRVKFAAYGETPGGDHGLGSNYGSSFASAKAAAYGAYYSWRNPSASRVDIEDAMVSSAVQDKYEIAGRPEIVRIVAVPKMSKAFVRIAEQDASRSAGAPQVAKAAEVEAPRHKPAIPVAAVAMGYGAGR